MAKSLGQIHTTKFNYQRAANAGLGEANAFLCDNSGKLSTQFQRNIRMMSTYKWVGADLVLQLPEGLGLVGTTDSTQVAVKGRMRYFAPTKARCDALRDAFKQFMTQAKVQGVDPRKNRRFDFRVLPRGLSNYPTNLDSGSPVSPNNEPIYNLTTLNGSDELCMIEGSTVNEVFTKYNENVKPVSLNPTGVFTDGLETQLSAGGTQTDFVLQEGLIQSGNSNLADVIMEEIPFLLTFNPASERAVQLNWRPDPALDVSVLGGFVEIVIDEVEADGATGPGAVEGIEMDISMHWAGWKSIIRAPRTRQSKKKVRFMTKAGVIMEVTPRSWGLMNKTGLKRLN